MNIRLIKTIAGRLSQTGGSRRFVNFARLTALISVLLGSMALIISLSTLEGFEIALRENAVKFRSHITLATFNRKPVENCPEIITRLKSKIPAIKNISTVMERKGLVRAKKNVEGALIRGIDPKTDFSGLEKNIVEGSYKFSSGKANEILIGKRLAEKLTASVGDKMIVYSMREDKTVAGLPETRVGTFIITGIYSTGMAQYDDVYVYIPYGAAAAFFRTPKNSAGSLEIILHDIKDVDACSARIENILGYPYYTRTVFEIHGAMFAWIDFQKEPIPIVLALISIVAVLNIVTTLLIIVVEKTHTIGILRALGMDNKSVLLTFVFQGVAIGFAGSAIGSTLGYIACRLQRDFEIIRLKGDIYFLDALPIHISLWHYELVIGVSLALAFIATLIPALAAVRISPMRAIRFK